jgi:PAS domain S-box-containing protein
MASLLQTISDDASLAKQLAEQPTGSQTLTLPPRASANLANSLEEGFVPARKVVLFGDTSEACGHPRPPVEAPRRLDGPTDGPKDGRPSGPPSGQTNAAEYRLIGKLGSGGTAVVYQAHQRAIDREVAIKMLRHELADDQSSRLRFLTEARVIGSLDHPNVIALHDLCMDDQGRVFYSMKRIDGTSWSEQIADRSVEQNLTILLRVADAIRYAHSRGLIHRDLKPENVMLGRFGEVLVADWGLAIRRGEFHSVRSPDDSLNSPGQPSRGQRHVDVAVSGSAIGGTPAYMAPEQAMGDLSAISSCTDVYLLGGILYQILTGQPPHHGKNLLDCIHSAANNLIQPTDVEGELMDAAIKAMADCPDDRFASVEDFIAAITDHRTHQESERLVRRATRRVWPAEPTPASADSYERFRVGEALLHEALALWPENARARSTLQRTQLEFARFAASQGDLDLSLRLYESAEQSQSEAALRVRRDLEQRERVRESQAKYSVLFTQSPEAGLLIRWSDGQVMEANEACLDLLGYEKSELVGQGISELSIWACPDRRKQFVAELGRVGRVDNFETQFVRKGGEGDCNGIDSSGKFLPTQPIPSEDTSSGVIDVLISSRTVEVSGESMLLSTIRDISQRRQAERNLEQSRRRLRDLQRLAGLGTWSYDPKANQVHWSEEAFRLSGRDPNQGEPDLDEFRELLHPDDRDDVNEAIRCAINLGASFQLKYRIRDQDGLYRSLLVRGQPVLDTDGKTVEVYGILQIANNHS